MMDITGKNRMPNRLLVRYLERGYPISCQRGVDSGLADGVVLFKGITLPDGMVLFMNHYNSSGGARACLQILNPNKGWELVFEKCVAVERWALPKVKCCQLENDKGGTTIYIVLRNRYPSVQCIMCWTWEAADGTNSDRKVLKHLFDYRIGDDISHSFTLSQDGLVYEFDGNTRKIRKYDIRHGRKHAVVSAKLSQQDGVGWPVWPDQHPQSQVFHPDKIDVYGNALMIMSRGRFHVFNRYTLEYLKCFVDQRGNVGGGLPPVRDVFLYLPHSWKVLSIDTETGEVAYCGDLRPIDDFLLLGVRRSMAICEGRHNSLPTGENDTIYVHDINSIDGNRPMVQSFPIRRYFGETPERHPGTMKGFAVVDDSFFLFVAHGHEPLEIQKFLLP